MASGRNGSPPPHAPAAAKGCCRRRS
uniref:Uncharacterized protein n=1 Tax=Arundo donax TaxID=35708 RepID=A0A0A9FA00_ARUDO